MKCCRNDTNDTNNKMNHNSKSPMSHLWMMVLCCGAPLILLFVVSLLGASFPQFKSALISVLPFICPVMMIFMIPMMFRHGKQDGDHNEKTQNKIENEEKSSHSDLLDN